MWSPKPSVFSLLFTYLDRLTPLMAAEYPPVHFLLVYTLFQDWSKYVNCSCSHCVFIWQYINTSISSLVNAIMIHDYLGKLISRKQRNLANRDCPGLHVLYSVSKQLMNRRQHVEGYNFHEESKFVKFGKYRKIETAKKPPMW